MNRTSILLFSLFEFGLSAFHLHAHPFVMCVRKSFSRFSTRFILSFYKCDSNTFSIRFKFLLYFDIQNVRMTVERMNEHSRGRERDKNCVGITQSKQNRRKTIEAARREEKKEGKKEKTQTNTSKSLTETRVCFLFHRTVLLSHARTFFFLYTIFSIRNFTG